MSRGECTTGESRQKYTEFKGKEKSHESAQIKKHEREATLSCFRDGPQISVLSQPTSVY